MSGHMNKVENQQKWRRMSRSVRWWRPRLVKFLKLEFPDMPGKVMVEKIDQFLNIMSTGDDGKKIKAHIDRLRKAAPVDEIDLAAEYAWVHVMESAEWDDIKDAPSKRAVTTLRWAKSGGGMQDFMKSHLKAVERLIGQGQKTEPFRDDLRTHDALADRLIAATQTDPEGFALVSPAGAHRVLSQRAEDSSGPKHPCRACGAETVVQNRIVGDEERQGRFCAGCTNFWLGGPEGTMLKGAGVVEAKI